MFKSSTASLICSSAYRRVTSSSNFQLAFAYQRTNSGNSRLGRQSPSVCGEIPAGDEEAGIQDRLGARRRDADEQSCASSTETRKSHFSCAQDLLLGLWQPIARYGLSHRKRSMPIIVEIFAALVVDLSSKSFIKQRAACINVAAEAKIARRAFPLICGGAKMNSYPGELDEVSGL